MLRIIFLVVSTILLARETTIARAISYMVSLKGAGTQ
jgi:hypothetical protein